MISYIGGKSIIGKWIRDYIPEDIETYVEPFGGMFWVFFCLDLDKYKNLKNIVYNDYNKLNANLFECVSEDYKKLADKQRLSFNEIFSKVNKKQLRNLLS